MRKDRILNDFRVSNPDFIETVKKSFSKQGLMRYLGATIDVIEPGYVSISMPYSDDLTQQHDYYHAGSLTSIVDSACGYAAYTLMPPNTEVLTIEFKVNFVSPAIGDRVVAHGRVVKPGSTVTVCQGEVIAIQDGREKVCAIMQATMLCRSMK
jgi:uncharacterized protein (TIGR00369 family)